MTADHLLESIADFVREATEDMELPVVVERGSGEKPTCPPTVYTMGLPEEKSSGEQVPFIVLEYLTGEDRFDEAQRPVSKAMVRLVVVLYTEDKEEGAKLVVNLITALRIAFLKQVVIGRKYKLLSPLEHLVYPEHEPPYYFGEMMTNWEMPVIEREVLRWTEE